MKVISFFLFFVWFAHVWWRLSESWVPACFRWLWPSPHSPLGLLGRTPGGIRFNQRSSTDCSLKQTLKSSWRPIQKQNENTPYLKKLQVGHSILIAPVILVSLWMTGVFGGFICLVKFTFACDINILLPVGCVTNLMFIWINHWLK